MTWAKALLWFFVVAAVFAAPAAMAQQTPPESNPLALEVYFYPKEPPAYQTIASSSRRWAWYARFGRIRGWTQPPGSPAITAVNIQSEMAEEGVRVWVSVFLGELHEQENKVSSYVLHEGEKVTVGELAQMGVEPFQIAVVRLSPSVSDLPKFISKAPSIEVVVMQPNLSTLPSYNVVVRNVSPNNVSAMRVLVMQGGRPRISSMPQGKEGQPLIVPGATYEFSSRVAIRATPAPGGYTPEILPDQVIEISSVVFADGSFEGDSEAAIAFAGFQKGRKIQLARVVHLFERSLAATGSAPSTLDWLKAEIAALSLEADSAAVQELLGRLPNSPTKNQPRVKTAIEVGMKGLRDEVLNDVTQFHLRNRRLDPNTLQDWLKSSRQRYEVWSGRL